MTLMTGLYEAGTIISSYGSSMSLEIRIRAYIEYYLPRGGDVV
jgi:hypothetical protein